MSKKCLFIEQLRYCYTAADIHLNGNKLSIRFHQELNIENGEDLIRFLLLPLCEHSLVDCSYLISIFTPSIAYKPYQLSLTSGSITIAHPATFSEIVIAS